MHFRVPILSLLVLPHPHPPAPLPEPDRPNAVGLELGGSELIAGHPPSISHTSQQHTIETWIECHRRRQRNLPCSVIQASLVSSTKKTTLALSTNMHLISPSPMSHGRPNSHRMTASIDGVIERGQIITHLYTVYTLPPQ